MSEPVMAQKGPYVGKMEPGSYWWCSCGKSARQPFCDGSHKGSTFTPLKVEIKESGQVAWCGCKRSKTAPFCDGGHAKLK